MKRFFVFILIVILIVPSFAACSEIVEDNNVTIVTTVFPEYDWVRQILGDATEGVELILLTENGTDLHSYQPTVHDIATISECDILIHTGGISDAWIEDALDLTPDKDRTVIRLMSLLSEDEKLTEQSLHHNVQYEGHEHEHSHEHEHDEHVWLSVRYAAHFCRTIAEVLGQKLPEHKEVYQKNGDEYVKVLSQLDARFQDVSVSVNEPTLLFADRFPFSYLMNDYGIACYAAFPGCSSETEASFKTVLFLSEIIDEHALSSVVVLESTDQRLAKSVIAATAHQNAHIVVMDSMQSITKKDLENGVTYLDIMNNNLDALFAALNG